MVAECQGVYSGLVVDEVIGLRHFPEEMFVAEPDEIEQVLRPYVHQGFSVDGEQWGIFKLLNLVRITSYNVCYTKLLRHGVHPDTREIVAVERDVQTPWRAADIEQFMQSRGHPHAAAVDADHGGVAAPGQSYNFV